MRPHNPFSQQNVRMQVSEAQGADQKGRIVALWYYGRYKNDSKAQNHATCTPNIVTTSKL